MPKTPSVITRMPPPVVSVILARMFELLLEALHVVVLEHETFAMVQAGAVDHAGVALAIVHQHVVAGEEGFDGAHAALVPEVQQEGVLLCP
jgi:hypothetical protein